MIKEPVLKSERLDNWVFMSTVRDRHDRDNANYAVKMLKMAGEKYRIDVREP